MNSAVLRHLSKADPIMARIIQAAGPCPLKPRARVTPFAALVESIVYQQLSGKAAAVIFNRFLGLFPGKGFPKPEAMLALSESALRGVGLSGAKASYIHNIAKHALEGRIPTNRNIHSLNDDAIVDMLTEIKGVGRWTVEMLLIFTLARPDVLPVHDLGIRKGFARAYGKRLLPEPKTLEKFGELWRPYRTTAAWYLWRAVEIPNKT